jgi:hypothetical protein
MFYSGLCSRFTQDLNMAEINVRAWQCDACAYVWLKKGQKPQQCANPACRSRKWDEKGIVAPLETIREVSAAVAPEIPKKPVQPEPEKKRVEAVRPEGVSDADWQNSFAREAEASRRSWEEEFPPPYSVEPGEALFFRVCEKRHHNIQTGYWIQCSLAQGHRGGCRYDGKQTSVYDDEASA